MVCLNGGLFVRQNNLSQLLTHIHCMFTHKYTHTNTHKHTYTHTHTHTHTNTHVHVHTRTHIHIHTVKQRCATHATTPLWKRRQQIRVCVTACPCLANQVKRLHCGEANRGYVTAGATPCNKPGECEKVSKLVSSKTKKK